MVNFTIGDRVLILGKNVTGEIAFVGHTHFLDGLCFGVILDEPKGRNNGSFEGVRYFKCPRNHGMFVRSCQLLEILQNESTVTKTENRGKNTLKYPNYLKSKNSFQFHENEWNWEALEARKVGSDTQLPTFETKLQKKEPNNQQQTVLFKNYYLKSMEVPNSKQNEANNPLIKMATTLNSIPCYFQKSEPQAFDNQVLTGTEKMKRRIKKLETELKFTRIVIENNTTDRENLKALLDYHQKHAYALQIKVNKLNRDFAESDRKVKSLEKKIEQLSEITEISIIEKEMAEHKIEQMETELEELTTTCQILRTELSIKEEEMQIQCEDKIPTVHYIKHLENQNKLMYNALLQLRKLYTSKHQNLLEAEETIKNNFSTLEDLKISQGNLQDVIFALNQDVSDMHETIDGLTEADELIFEVTDYSLILEHKMIILVESLKIMEEYSEVSDEIEEILQESYMEREKDMEAIKYKLYMTERSLTNAIQLVNKCKEELERYKNLVFDLRTENAQLKFKLDTVTEERKLAVMEAENLKLQFQRENKMALQHLIRDDNLEIENQVVQQKVKYLEMYLPENYFGRNEHLALEGKLLLLKMIQKLNLFQKYITIRYRKYSFHSRENQLQVSKFQTYFLIKLFTLQELLKIYDASLDFANIEKFLASGAYCEILNIKLREIDNFLDLFCRNDLDTPRNIKSLNNMKNMFYTMLNLQFCPEQEKRIITIEFLLKKILVCVRLIEEYFMVFKIPMKYSENEKLQKSEFTFRTLPKDISFLLNCITVSKNNQMICYNEETVCHLKRMLKEIVVTMKNFVKICDRIYDGEENISAEFMLKELKKLEEISTEIKLIKNYILSEKNLESSPVLSSFETWIRERKVQEDKLLDELQRKAFCFENNLAKLKKQQIKGIQIIKQSVEESSQTDETINEIIKNEGTSILSLKLYDMECSVNFLNFKVHQLQMERAQKQLSCLTPLKLPPKIRRYHPHVHNIIVFQKSLNELSADLMKIVMPTVVDITSKRNIHKSFKSLAFIHRDLKKKDIQKRIQNLETEIYDFKNENRFK